MGKHTILCSVNGKSKNVTIDVDSDSVARLNASLQQLKDDGSRPCGYFDHQRGARSLEPLGFSWEDGRGVMLEAELTKAGQEALQGGDYVSFSPRFALSQGCIAGLVPRSAEVGSFVNEPAFRDAMPNVLAAAMVEAMELGDAPYLELCASFARDNLAHAREIVEQPQMDDNTHKGEDPHTSKQVQLNTMKNIAEKLGLPDDATEEQILEAIGSIKQKAATAATPPPAPKNKEDDKDKEKEELSASLAAKDAEKSALEAQIVTLSAALASQQDSSAHAFVEAACAAGKIAPLDAKGKASWASMFKADPEAASSAMSSVMASLGNTSLKQPEQDSYSIAVASVESELANLNS